MTLYTAPLACVALPEDRPLSSNELGEVIPAAYGRSPVLPLYQWWEAPWQLPQEHAKARCGFTPTHLCFYLYMVDADVVSYATANDQKMWQLGDCVEVFIKPEGDGRTDYWEIHITPSGYIMDIHIKERGNWDWDEAVAQQSGARHAVCMTERGWVAELRVPWSAFGMRHPPPAGTAWRINVGRYNVTSSAPFDSQAFQMSAGGERELSASAPLTVGSFHNFEEFNQLVFGPLDPAWEERSSFAGVGFVPDKPDLSAKL